MHALDHLLRFPAFGLVRFRDTDTVTLLAGHCEDLDTLADVPLETGPPPPGRRFDRLLLVPYRQIRERGFAAHDDGTPLRSLVVEYEVELDLAELTGGLPDVPAEVADPGGFDISDPDYATLVKRVVADEIGQGEGANLVIARSRRARLAGWGHQAALSAFRHLLRYERGTYWTFCVFDGDRYLLGATPERHVSVHGGDVRMNPISGTFALSGSDDRGADRRALLDFLADRKEIYELFMVVDEELKVMCEVCSEGGQVLGPYLKEMSRVAHTEYLLAGRTSRDVRAVLRDTMYAATVTGSPVENACRLITRYEPRGRGYYGAVLALLGRDVDGAPTADAPIVIRTADVDLGGNLRVTVGATLVRDSVPQREVAETHAKAAAVLAAFGIGDSPSGRQLGPGNQAADDDVRIALGSRNQRLSKFWLTDQSSLPPQPELAGRTVLVLDGADDFVNMLRHVLRTLGMAVVAVRYDGFERESLTDYDLVVVGPGPGDPRDASQPKIAAFVSAVDHLLSVRHPFLAVCLGHQVLASRLGLGLYYKDIVFQGTQTVVDIHGRSEPVGFYNTFVARDDGRPLPEGVELSTDHDTGDVHLLRGPHFAGVQFHAESILTEHGLDILRDLACTLLHPTHPPR